MIKKRCQVDCLFAAIPQHLDIGTVTIPIQNQEIHYDGEILINKGALVEPEIHKKVKKTSTGKKQLYETRIVAAVNVSELINNGEIRILKACKNEFAKSTHEYYLAQRIIDKNFIQYQERGGLPDTCAFV